MNQASYELYWHLTKSRPLGHDAREVIFRMMFSKPSTQCLRNHFVRGVAITLKEFLAQRQDLHKIPPHDLKYADRFQWKKIAHQLIVHLLEKHRYDQFMNFTTYLMWETIKNTEAASNIKSYLGAKSLTFSVMTLAIRIERYAYFGFGLDKDIWKERGQTINKQQVNWLEIAEAWQDMARIKWKE